jgi:hypothetical protein
MSPTWYHHGSSSRPGTALEREREKPAHPSEHKDRSTDPRGKDVMLSTGGGNIRVPVLLTHTYKISQHHFYRLYVLLRRFSYSLLPCKLEIYPDCSISI